MEAILHKDSSWEGGSVPDVLSSLSATACCRLPGRISWIGFVAVKAGVPGLRNVRRLAFGPFWCFRVEYLVRISP